MRNVGSSPADALTPSPFRPDPDTRHMPHPSSPELQSHPRQESAPGHCLLPQARARAASGPGSPTQGRRIPVETVAPAAPPIRPAAGLPTGAAVGTRVPGQAQPKRGEGRALTSTPTAVGVRHPQPRQPEPRQPLCVKNQRPLFEASGTARRGPPPKPRAGAALTPPPVPGRPCSTTGS